MEDQPQHSVAGSSVVVRRNLQHRSGKRAARSRIVTPDSSDSSPERLWARRDGKLPSWMVKSRAHKSHVAASPRGGTRRSVSSAGRRLSRRRHLQPSSPSSSGSRAARTSRHVSVATAPRTQEQKTAVTATTIDDGGDFSGGCTSLDEEARDLEIEFKRLQALQLAKQERRRLAQKREAKQQKVAKLREAVAALAETVSSGDEACRSKSMRQPSKTHHPVAEQEISLPSASGGRLAHHKAQSQKRKRQLSEESLDDDYISRIIREESIQRGDAYQYRRHGRASLGRRSSSERHEASPVSPSIRRESSVGSTVS